MTYIIDLQRLWQDRGQISSQFLQLAPGAYIDPRHMTVSVIMVIYHKQKKLSRKLIPFLKDPLVREVQLVCCHRDPGSLVSALVLQHPKCYLVDAELDLSPVDAYQLGARRASGHLLLFLDPEMDLTHESFMRLLSTGLRKPHPWAVGVHAESLNIFHRQRSASRVLPEVFLSGGGIHVPAVSPNCLLIPTTDYWDLKGLDPTCQVSTFHLDLCMRIHLAGGGVYQATDIAPEAQCTWVPPQRTWRQKWQVMQGWWRYYQKHYSKKANFFMGLDKPLLALCLLGRFLIQMR